MKYYRLTPIVFAFFCLSCSNNSDDSDVFETLSENKLTAKINGKKFAAFDDAAFAGLSQSDNITVFLISGANSNVTSNNFATEAISLSFILENTELSVGSQWYTNSENVIVVGVYANDENPLEDNDFSIEASIENTDENNIRIRITQIDYDAETISGEFEFTAVDEDTGQLYSITEGRFNEVSFENN